MKKVKFKQSTKVMTNPEYSSVPFEIIYLDFAELKTKEEGSKRTQARLLSIDECTRTITAKSAKEYSVSGLLKAGCFKHTKALVCDNGPAFLSAKLSKCSQEHGILINYSPYHPTANSPAERVIRDVKQYLKLCHDFAGGWKCCSRPLLNIKTDRTPLV